MSTGLSTKDVKTVGSSGPSKTVQPGNRELYIRSVTLEQIGDYAKSKNAYHLILHVEGKPMGDDFEGFHIDPKDESKGRYTGQVGRVKTSDWPYSDGTTKQKVVISRDMEIMKMIKTLCVAIKKEDWFDAQDGKHATIEAFVEAFNNEAPFKDVLLNFCIAGREYPKKDTSFTGMDLQLPKFKDGKVAFELPGVEKSKLIQFNPDVHIVKVEEEPVANFAGDGGEPAATELGAPPAEFTL